MFLLDHALAIERNCIIVEKMQLLSRQCQEVLYKLIPLLQNDEEKMDIKRMMAAKMGLKVILYNVYGGKVTVVNNVVKEQEREMILKSTSNCSNFVNHVFLPKRKKYPG